MKIDGSCHCGSITYEAELEPEAVGICHCSDCQALSASRRGWRGWPTYSTREAYCKRFGFTNDASW